MKTNNLIASIWLICFIAAISGCVSAPIQPIITPLDSASAAELSRFLTAGTSTIQGQAFLRTRGGSVIYGAGSRVFLVPYIQYTNMRFRNGFDVSSDPVLSKYTRQTIADANGNFAFSDVPAGAYVAVSEVYWEAPRGRFMEKQGGTVQAIIQVAQGQTVKAILQ
jgi:hypothetical protein